jgi:hypothetical protein
MSLPEPSIVAEEDAASQDILNPVIIAEWHELLPRDD